MRKEERHLSKKTLNLSQLFWIFKKKRKENEKNWHYIDFANKANIVIFWTLFNYSKRKKRDLN